MKIKQNHMSFYIELFGELRILRLLPESVPRCYDIRGDQIVIGMENGQVLLLNVRRKERTVFEGSCLLDLEIGLPILQPYQNWIKVHIRRSHVAYDESKCLKLAT